MNIETESRIIEESDLRADFRLFCASLVFTTMSVVSACVTDGNIFVWAIVAISVGATVAFWWFLRTSFRNFKEAMIRGEPTLIPKSRVLTSTRR